MLQYASKKCEMYLFQIAGDLFYGQFTETVEFFKKKKKMLSENV